MKIEVSLREQGLFHGGRAKERDPSIRRVFLVLSTCRKDQFLWVPCHASWCAWRFDLMAHFARLRRDLRRK
jgi:hypothetical protein